VSCYGTGRAMDQAADTFSSEPDAMSRRCAAHPANRAKTVSKSPHTVSPLLDCGSPRYTP